MDVSKLLFPEAQQFFPTGSSVICDPPVLDTDFDYVVKVSGEDSMYILRDKIREAGGTLCGKEYPEDQFLVLRLGKYNFMICEDREVYEDWFTATEVAKRLNLLKKEDRVLLFSVLVDKKFPIPELSACVSLRPV